MSLILVPLFLAQISASQFPAQTEPPRPSEPKAAQTKPEDFGSLEGKITNASTGEPIKKVLLTLRRADPSPSKVLLLLPSPPPPMPKASLR